MRDPIAMLAGRQQPQTLGERLGVALDALAPAWQRKPKRGPSPEPERLLAERSGVAVRLIQLYLRDRYTPHLRTVEWLAKAMGVRPGWLAWGELPIRPRTDRGTGA